MNRNLIILMTLCVFAACKPAGDQTQKEAETAAAPESVSIPFAGDWLHATYYQSIMDDKSPHDAQEKSYETFIRIPSSTAKKTIMIYGFHESGPDLRVVAKNGQFSLWAMQADTLEKEAYTLAPVDENHLRIGDQLFVRIHPVDGKDNPLILEDLLFKGKYTTEKGGAVEFKNNGEVTGLDPYKYYSVLVDYLDAGLQIDQVGLASEPDNWTYFGFKFKKEKLELYQLKCLEFDKEQDRCVDVDFGKKAYSLTAVH